MIEVKDISRAYGEKIILDGVSVTIPKGKVTSLIGSNGAGKSTLLSIISRLLKQNGGTVLLDSQDIEAYKTRILAQHLSILKQANHVDLKLTVRELVSFGRFPYSQGRLTSADKEQVDRAIGYLNLQDIAGQYMDELSGGQKQRAFLAMVVAQDTDYILLDEPLNNLDMKHAVQIMKTLRKLCDEKGKTIVMVIHDINFASQYSDFIVALKDSRVAIFDTVDRVIVPEVLQKVFDMDFKIVETDGKKICNYY